MRANGIGILTIGRDVEHDDGSLARTTILLVRDEEMLNTPGDEPETGQGSTGSPWMNLDP